jgi:hypothetical protein
MAKKVLKKKMQSGGDVSGVENMLKAKKRIEDYRKREEEFRNIKMPNGTIVENFGARDPLGQTRSKNTNMMKKGGMIKRADGSMSKRGLWDNIRANKGSGKKPTAAMLKQEKKIKAQTKKK